MLQFKKLHLLAYKYLGSEKGNQVLKHKYYIPGI